MERTRSKNNSFDDLKVYMNACLTVHEWNEKREKAKILFTQSAINKLDSSGFIVESLRVGRERQQNPSWNDVSRDWKESI